MDELEGYEEKEPKDSHQRLLRLLVDWQRKQENPTVGALVAACEYVGVGGGVKRVLQYSKED